MKKKIILLRHVQSAGKQGSQQDYDRVLSPDGERAAINLGPLLSQQPFSPEFILSSSSCRTRRTTELINETLRLPASQILFSDSLYEASPAEWIDQIRRLPAPLQCSLLVGHNPTISLLAGTFANRLIDLAPGGFITFEFTAVTWADLPESTGVRIEQVKSPR